MSSKLQRRRRAMRRSHEKVAKERTSRHGDGRRHSDVHAPALDADSKTTQIYAHYQPSDHEADAVDRAFA